MDLSKYRNKLIGSEDERAVSPVIGVILMVAITVILAAVIAAFVLDMGDDLGNNAPNSQLSYDTNPAYNNTSSDTLAGTLDHDGGDDLSLDEVEIRINGVNESDTLDSVNGFDNDVTATLNGNSINGDETYGVGDSIEISDSSQNVIEPGEEYELVLIHQPSDSKLMDKEFTAADN